MTNEVKNVPELRFPEFDEEWEKKRLKDICKVNPKFEDNFPSEFNYIDLESVKKGKIYKISKYTMHNAPSRAQRVAKQGDIFFQTVRPYQQNNFVFVDDSYPTVVSTGYAQLRSNLNPSYLDNLLLTTSFLNKVLVKCTGSNYPAINSSDLSNIHLKVTSNIDEQQKIGDFFSKLDQQIELEEQKLEKLEEQKKGYMQKIFSQELRFKDENGNEYPNWETKKLDNMLSERNYKQVPEKDVPLMAFTSTGGIEDKGERYNREFLVKNKNKKYKRTEFNDLIYSSNNLDVGAIGLNRYGTSVISDVYEIFVVKEKTSPQYIEMAITQPKFMYKILKYRQGALYGQFKIHPRDFLNIDIELPSTKEQDKIGSFINKMNILINKQKNKIELLKQRKQGFLQKMFV